jgi:hypothetical protein
MDVRRTIGNAAGTLDYCAAVLSRLQHGPQRADVENIRAKLTETSADLLLLRARLATSEAREGSDSTP